MAVTLYSSRNRLCSQFVRSADFVEGISSVLIERRTPNWSRTLPSNLALWPDYVPDIPLTRVPASVPCMRPFLPACSDSSLAPPILLKSSQGSATASSSS